MGKEFIAVELVWQSLGVPRPGPASLRDAEGLGAGSGGYHHRLLSDVPPGHGVRGRK